MLQPEPALDFLVRDDSASFDIGEALLDLVDEVQALHRVLESRVGGKTLDGLKDALLGRGWSGHAWLGVSDVGNLHRDRTTVQGNRSSAERCVHLQAASQRRAESAPCSWHLKGVKRDGFLKHRA
jgi:hypothetical protein